MDISITGIGKNNTHTYIFLYRRITISLPGFNLARYITGILPNIPSK